MKQILILAHAGDVGAMTVGKVIASQLGGQAVAMLQPEILARSQWSHRLDCHGRAITWFKLPSQKEFSTDSIGCLFDRLQYLPHLPFSHSSPKNQDYAAAEFHALVTSWLWELGECVVNPLKIGSGIVSQVSPSKWLSFAHQCGLPIIRYGTATAGSLLSQPRSGELLHADLDLPSGVGGIPVKIEIDEAVFAPGGSVFVCGERVVGSLAEEFGTRCLQLARAVGCNLLEVRFGSISGQLRVLEVSTQPLLDARWSIEATAELLINVARERKAAI